MPSPQTLTQLNHKELIHIVISFGAAGALLVATLQALLLAVSQWLIRHKRTATLLQVVPPLQTMETVLYQLVWISVGLLSTVIISSVWLFGNIFISPLWAKSVLVLVSWGVLVGLLIGRYAFGWRGPTVVRMTVVGFVCVMVAYFLSQWLGI